MGQTEPWSWRVTATSDSITVTRTLPTHRHYSHSASYTDISLPNCKWCNDSPGHCSDLLEWGVSTFHSGRQDSVQTLTAAKQQQLQQNHMNCEREEAKRPQWIHYDNQQWWHHRGMQDTRLLSQWADILSLALTTLHHHLQSHTHTHMHARTRTHTHTHTHARTHTHVLSTTLTLRHSLLSHTIYNSDSWWQTMPTLTCVHCHSMRRRRQRVNWHVTDRRRCQCATSQLIQLFLCSQATMLIKVRLELGKVESVWWTRWQLASADTDITLLKEMQNSLLVDLAPSLTHSSTYSLQAVMSLRKPNVSNFYFRCWKLQKKGATYPWL